MSRTSICWSLVGGGVKVVVQGRYRVFSAASESLRKTMDQEILLSEFPVIYSRISNNEIGSSHSPKSGRG
jgi:hypothetical protein